MTTVPRSRFSVRLGLAEEDDEAPYEGVPRHLLQPLQRWVRSHFSSSQDDDAEDMCLRLRIAVPSGGNPTLVLTAMDGMDLLDVVDAILAHEEEDMGGDPDGELARVLDGGGSAYQVNDEGNGLEERVTPAVREAVRTTITDANALSAAGSAGDHLSMAWQAAYGLEPDPVRVYSEAIKAVECAAHAVVQPNHARATLGTMIGELRSKPQLFTAAVPRSQGIGVVEMMMSTLWDGQTSRHGKQSPTVPETLESARAALHLAAVLVQWFTSGAVARLP
ncbi:hypothetical protein [Kitasatospora sp. NPDC001527]|uniref:hypothetical protein n=1 Tax=Kitasatospora sp. NPDC001527 TaxID=3154519 RepID=UPI0033264FC5